MKKLLIDTCVWLDYIWQEKATDPKADNSSKKLIESISGDENYQIILSPFLIREISSHYKDWFVLQKIIKDGFSCNDFKKIKNDYFLDEQEVKEINKIIIDIGGIDNVNVLNVSALNEDEVARILLLESQYNFDIYDAIHFNTAIMEKCDLFVTRDAALRKSISHFNQKNKNGVDCVPPKSFLESLVKK